MSLNKIRVLPDQYLFMQGDKGDSAYLVISGSFRVERDEKKVGNISEGEIFGELSLILKQNRAASIRAVVPSEIVEIKKKALDELLLSSNIKVHKLITELSSELSKNLDQKLPISLNNLKELVKDEPQVISKLSLQLHHRLSQMIFS